MSLQTILDELPSMTSTELKKIVIAANRLLKKPKLYIRQVGKTVAGKHYMYLVATWQEDGKTRQKSLGTMAEAADTPFGVDDADAVEFLNEKQAEGFRIVV